MIALATCRAHPELDPDARLLLEALARHGLKCEPAIWDDPSYPWDSADAVVVRSTWDYQHHLGEFLAWSRRVGEATALWNPPEVLAWNADKAYLTQATEALPYVPTHLVEATEAAALEAELAGRNWADVVIKPRIGASGADTWRWTVGEELPEGLRDRLARGGMLVQPWLDTVLDEGEWSCFYFDGELSHSARKHPAAGEFRVQEEHGGRTVLAEAPEAAATVAGAALASLEQRLLYARVDLLRDRRGGWLVSELELIEPSMYLALAPGAADRFAGAVSRRLS